MHPLLCPDDWLAAVNASTRYHWIWSFSSCGFLCIVILLVERLRRSNILTHANSVHSCVTALANLTRSDQFQKLLQRKWNQSLHWKFHALKAVSWRRSLFYLLLMIVLALSMVPACGYVLAQVTPSFCCVLLYY